MLDWFDLTSVFPEPVEGLSLILKLEEVQGFDKLSLSGF